MKRCKNCFSGEKNCKLKNENCKMSPHHARHAGRDFQIFNFQFSICNAHKMTSRYRRPVNISIFLLLSLLSFASSAQESRSRRVDDPDDQEDLNRELWEFAKHTPYESILSYVAEAQRRSKANESAEV